MYSSSTLVRRFTPFSDIVSKCILSRFRLFLLSPFSFHLSSLTPLPSPCTCPLSPVLPDLSTYYLTVIKEWSLETVQKYMGFINLNAELAVRSLMKEAVVKAGSTRLHALDRMDDGTPIELTIDIDPETGSAVFDFEGTGYESWSSLNAPVAVCSSAVIYCLRALCGSEIPLNAGCLEPITRLFFALFLLQVKWADFRCFLMHTVRIPEGTIINPSATCAVVGGNVTTSQRITDVVLKAFNAVAASQGCCNNLTFGNEDFGFYETIAGGTGAGPSWDGESGVVSSFPFSSFPSFLSALPLPSPSTLYHLYLIMISFHPLFLPFLPLYRLFKLLSAFVRVLS